MKYSLLIILLTLQILSACSEKQDVYIHQVGNIVGEARNLPTVSGVGVMLDDKTILTSAHVVADDRHSYTFRTQSSADLPLSIALRDETRDLALMIRRGEVDNKIQFSLARENLLNGDSIYALVFRSGVLTKISGTLTSTGGSIRGYTPFGETRILTGIILSTLSVLPGDSGAPIYNSSGELIDVVHLMIK